MIRLESVAVRYGENSVGLHQVSVAFHGSQFTVLVGRSGAGKSTLLRTLNHLTPPTQGAVLVEGIGELRRGEALRRHRRNTAMIFQQHQLISRFTALQNVMVGRLGKYPSWRTPFPLAARDRRLGLECLDRVGLLHRALDRTDRLSGGEQQRVGIARALAQEPAVILADEPVASLDPATSEQVLGHLHTIAKQDGIPAIVSLHQVDLARAFADRIVGLSAGRIVFDGPPDALSAGDYRRIYGESGGLGGAMPEPPAGHEAKDQLITAPLEKTA